MLSEEIIKLRKKDGLSQQEFADLVGVTRQMVSLWERGVFLPDDEHLQAICRAFDLPKQYFAQAASASEAEQELAVSASAATPAPVCGSDGCPCAHCRKFRPKKNNKVVKGLIIGGLLAFFLFVFAVILAILITTLGEEEAITSEIVFSFHIPLMGKIILVGVVCAIAICVLIYLFWKNFHRTKKKNDTKPKERRGTSL